MMMWQTTSKCWREPAVGATEIADRCAFIPDAMLREEGGGVGA